MRKHTHSPLEIDRDALMAYAVQDISRHVAQPARRAFFKRSLTLGGLSLLSGCVIGVEASAEAALTKISRWNDKVQGYLSLKWLQHGL